MVTRGRNRRKPSAVLALASACGLVGGFLLGAAAGLPDAISETWRSLWMLTGLAGASIGTGVALVTAVVWVLVERRTPRDRDLRLLLLPPVTAFSVVIAAHLVIGQSPAVFSLWSMWALGLVAALAAAVSMRWVGWRGPRERGAPRPRPPAPRSPA